MGIPTSECRQYFAYLSERSRDEEIPEECITCPKVIGCILHKIRTCDNIAEETDKWHREGARITRYGTCERRQPLPPLESLLVFP